MNLTIRINDTGIKAKSIINLLRNLAEDYDFIEIYENTENLPELTINEYQKRYKYSLEHIEEGLTISEMEQKLYPDEEKKV
jgi:hypothetical protein